MRRFETAKVLLAALNNLGWIVVAIGALFFFISAETFVLAIRIVTSLAISVQGLLIVLMAQLGHAQIATAENTREMLQEIRDANRRRATVNTLRRREESVHEVAPDQSASLAESGPPIETGPYSGMNVGDVVRVHKGYQIRAAENGVAVEADRFPNAFEAEKWINALIANPRKPD